MNSESQATYDHIQRTARKQKRNVGYTAENTEINDKKNIFEPDFAVVNSRLRRGQWENSDDF